MATARILLVVLLVLGLVRGIAASGHAGQVTFGGLPVPGATVTATKGTHSVATTTDQEGVYRFADLADGAWSVKVEMRGFATLTREVTVSASAMPEQWELMLLSFDDIAKSVPLAHADTPAPAPTTGVAPARAATKPVQNGFRRADVTAATRTAAASAPPPPEPPTDSAQANDGLVIDGSVNNGAASPFAQPAAFGNTRRRPGALYTGALGFQGDTSAWDARPFSFTNVAAPRPSYNDMQFIGLFQGPVLLPGVHQNRLNVFAGYQHTANHDATTQPTNVPTDLERLGDFSQATDALGRAIRITDPLTGRPFPGNAIPSSRISPAAAALLHLYPEPNVSDGSPFNFQAPLITATRQDSVQSRFQQPISSRNQLTGTIAFQRTATDATSPFDFLDTTVASTLDTTTTWTHRLSPFVWLRPRFQFTQQINTTTPYFANRTNVSGDAGIVGNDQTAANWGPPTLVFSSGIQSLTDGQSSSTSSRTSAPGVELFLSHGRHSYTFGGDGRFQRIGINAQQNPRGQFTFNGAYTGSDLADFLLGIPRTGSIAYGNADKQFSSLLADAYVRDDYRLSPSLTLDLGVRWEYESPMTEAQGRLVNLDVSPGFAAVAPVLARSPDGPLTGRHYGSSLLRPDRLGIQPRTMAAWRPVPGSSLVIRAGYGIYRNTSVYQSITTLLAQQPPLSRAFSLENSVANPLTMATAFAAPVAGTTNTFAVDPDFRVGYAHNWQVSAQRDLPGSMTVTATYLGTKGSHLMQEFLPNTSPPGAANPCPACPAGFVYLTSNGRSIRNAAQLQLRRRLRNGLTWTTQYTLSKSTDNATAFTGVNLAGSAIAQDWTNVGAELGPSAFDQRHLMTATVEYTTGVGAHGGGLLSGVKGALVNGWTMSGQLNAGSGLPFSPVYLTQVPGTGVIGSVRADLTGAPTDPTQPGYYFNPAAFAIPVGHWGTAGRNSLRGPAQFGLNASLTRTFPWGSRRNWDWRIDATNVLNRVTYSTIDTIVGTPQFGLPTASNTMRKIQTSLRLRF